MEDKILTLQLKKLSSLKQIKENLKNGIPILIGDDAINLVDAYIPDIEDKIGEINLDGYIQ